MRPGDEGSLLGMMRAAFNAGALAAGKDRSKIPPEDADGLEIDTWLDGLWDESHIGKAVAESTVVDRSEVN